MAFKRIATSIAIYVLMVAPLLSQEYHGTSGLLHAPSAVMEPAGTFRAAVTFLDKRFTPSQLHRDGQKYNTMGYTIGLSIFPWVEVSYSATLLYMHRFGRETEPLGYYNEDRHINVKLRPLKEDRWWPAIALGLDDIGRFRFLTTHEDRGNGFFRNFYVAGSKHFDIKGYELGAHLAYRYYPVNANADRRGIAGGLTLRPAFYKSLRLITEWDGIGVNAGADVLLWKHLFLQACLVHGKGFSGVVSYHYQIPF